MLTRVPKRIRERISRPNSSLPNGCCQEGPSSRSFSFWSAGSYGASHGAKIADTVNATTIVKPTSASLFLRKNSIIPNAGIHDRIKQIRRKIDEDVSQRDRQEASLG